MIPLALQLFDSPGGALLLDLHNATSCASATADHGYQIMDCFLPLQPTQAFLYHDQAPGKWLTLNYGVGSVWEGRVEDRAIVTGGLRLTAFGAWRALADVPYTALWSDSRTSGWNKGTDDQNALFLEKRFSIDTDNRLFISPNKNQTFTSGVLGALHFLIPHSSSRNIVGVEFDYELDAPSSWQCRLTAMSTSYALGTTIWDLTSSGSVLSGSLHFSITATAGLVFWLRLNSGTPTTFAGENGASFLKISNLRIVTSVTNRVNTSVAGAISSGSQIVTPGSMNGIAVGDQLIINSSGASERITVTAITSSTFTATFASAHAAGALVRIHRIYADQIIKDLVSHVVAVNPEQLSSSTALIESPGLDLLDEVYEDQYPADIAVKLAQLGDNQSPPRRWEVGVWERQKLHFRPQSSAAQEWFVDADDLEVDSTMETLINSGYGVYNDANGRALRTAVADDEDSQAKYGIVRRTAVSVNTTSATQVGVHRDTVIADGAVIKPRSVLMPDCLMDEAGGVYPKWMCRAGDTITIRNLPPTLSQDIDRIRTFRVKEVSYDWISNALQVTPEEPPASLDFLLARQAGGVA